MEKFNGCAYNYTGSKARFMNTISGILPKESNLKVLDIFTGASSLATQLPKSWSITANDIEHKLIQVHKAFQDELRRGQTPQEIVEFVKLYCHSFVKTKNDKDGYFNLVRSYNEDNTPLKLYGLICSSFSNQLRWNSSGEWNLPFGQRFFNSNMEKKLLLYLENIQSRDITFQAKDFKEHDFTEYDLVISDSPYLKTLAGYQDKSDGWDFKDSVALLSKLDKYVDKGGRFILFEELWSKSVPNQLLLDWSIKYNIKQIGDNSSGSNYQRKGGRTQEVIIYNY